MLRLTTNVTVSPASSARSSSAAWRMSSIASGRVSANSAVSSSALSHCAVARPLDRARHEVAADRAAAPPATRAAPRDERPVLRLDDVEHALRRSTPGRCTAGRRTAARSARRRPARAACAPGAATGTGCSGEMWSPLADRPPRSVAPAATSSRPPVGEVRRDLDADVRHQPRGLRDQPLHVVDRRPASPTPAAAASGAVARCRCASTRCAASSRSRPAPRRSSAGAGRSSGGSPPAGGRARRAPRPAPRAPRSRSSSRLADPDEDPARERDPQLAGRRGSSPAAAPGPSSASPGAPTRSSRIDSSISPCDAVTSRSRARSSRDERAEVRVRQQPALERPLAAPRRRRRRSPRTRAPRAARARPGDAPGSSPVSTSSSLTRRRAAPSSRRSTSSGACRCGRCVANAQYLQCDTHVRDSDSVTLREKVTRRRIGRSLPSRLLRPVPPRGAGPAPDRRCDPGTGAAASWPADGPPPPHRARPRPRGRARCGLRARRGPAERRRGDRARRPAGAVDAGIYLARERGSTRPRASRCGSAHRQRGARAPEPARRPRAVRDPRHPRPRARGSAAATSSA